MILHNNTKTTRHNPGFSHLIKLFTKKDAIVVDPFMGSGTTAVACHMTDRNYIGFELNQEYIDITKKRLEEIDSNVV
jgi:DNA modification methylase